MIYAHLDVQGKLIPCRWWTSPEPHDSGEQQCLKKSSPPPFCVLGNSKEPAWSMIWDSRMPLLLMSDKARHRLPNSHSLLPKWLIELFCPHWSMGQNAHSPTFGWGFLLSLDLHPALPEGSLSENRLDSGRHFLIYSSDPDTLLSYFSALCSF